MDTHELHTIKENLPAFPVASLIGLTNELAKRCHLSGATPGEDNENLKWIFTVSSLHSTCLSKGIGWGWGFSRSLLNITYH